MKKLDKEQFIYRSILFHGDKYQYSKVHYVSNNVKVIISCPKHGDFYQTPSSHMIGKGCSKCGKDKLSEKYRFTTEQFVERAKRVHGDKYDYSEVAYLKQSVKVKIKCHKHGFFTQLPGNHLAGYECFKCGCNSISNSKLMSTSDFVLKAKRIHGDLYDYSLVEYLDSCKKVDIFCYKHGKFQQKPANHLMGQGCPGCRCSKGENLIRIALDTEGIVYHKEYKLPETPQYKYRYDFYLPDLDILIEFHGIQHFKPIAYFGGESAYKETVFRDSMKKSIAKSLRKRIVYYNYKHLKQLSDEEFQKFVISSLKRFTK